MICQKILFQIIRAGFSNRSFGILFKMQNSEPNGNILCTIHAEDPDQGANGRIRYFIKDDERNLIHTDLFSINSDNGQLTLNKPLNREETAKYTVSLKIQGRQSNKVPTSNYKPNATNSN